MAYARREDSAWNSSTRCQSHQSTQFASSIEAIVQRDLQAIGIKLDIQNYPENSLL